jgi:Zn finger protein HypA/HybF involved in hydrogenase expression
MTDTILTMSNGSKWKPSKSSDTVHCVNCDHAVHTPEETSSCPSCGQSWTGAERRSTSITVTAPAPLGGSTL